MCCRAQWHLMVLIAGISSNGILMHTTNLLLAFLFLAKLTLHVISCISTYWTHYSPSHSLSDSVCRYSIQLTDYCLCNQKDLEIPNIPTFHSISIRYNVMTGARCTYIKFGGNVIWSQKALYFSIYFQLLAFEVIKSIVMRER